MTIIVRRQERLGTTAQWAASILPLLAGEIGVETTSGGTYVGMKVGDGTHLWAALTYVGSAGSVASVNGQIGTVVLAAADVGAQPHTATLDGTTASFTTAKDTKLSGIATGATANAVGNTVLDPGTGKLEYAWPYGGLFAGASRSYVSTDRGFMFSRSNSGAAMSDTLPTLTNTTADIGWSVTVHNEDTTTTAVLTMNGSGGALFRSNAGATSATSPVNYGCRQTFVWSGTQWLLNNGNANLTRRSGAIVAGHLPQFLDTAGNVVTDSGIAAASVALSASPTFTGTPTAPVWSTTGITGSVAASRWVGATATGAPVAGTFLLGDWIITQDGSIFICTTAGTPGTWTQANAGSYALKSIVDIFNATGTWTKRAGLTSVQVDLLSGGGQGGQGRRGAAGTIRCGGGSGSAGGAGHIVLPASALGATETVTVGIGGTGATAATTDDTDGAAGASGQNSAFGSHVSTLGGGGGSGGTATTGAAGTSGSGLFNGGVGGSAVTTGPGAAGATASLVAGGGAGASITAANAGAAGGNGGVIGNNRQVSAPSGGTSAPGAAANGAVPDVNSAQGGSGGGGGGTNGTTATAGGTGIHGSGGGGGGASLNGNAAGQGGAGGNGIVVVVNYF